MVIQAIGDWLDWLVGAGAAPILILRASKKGWIRWPCLVEWGLGQSEIGDHTPGYRTHNTTLHNNIDIPGVRRQWPQHKPLIHTLTDTDRKIWRKTAKVLPCPALCDFNKVKLLYIYFLATKTTTALLKCFQHSSTLFLLFSFLTHVLLNALCSTPAESLVFAASLVGSARRLIRTDAVTVHRCPKKHKKLYKQQYYSTLFFENAQCLSPFPGGVILSASKLQSSDFTRLSKY